MIFHKNKYLLWLSLFLPISTTVYCMKRSSSELTNIEHHNNQTVQDVRNALISYNYKNNCIHFEQPFYQENHEGTLFFCLSDNSFLERYKKFIMLDYSFLGLATICMSALQYPQEPSFLQKKEFIQELITLGFVPTQEDKKLAALEKRERCKPSIQKISFFRYAYFASEILPEFSIPKELIDNISLLMWNTEESLL